MSTHQFSLGTVSQSVTEQENNVTRLHFPPDEKRDIQINIEGPSGGMDVRALTVALQNFVEYLNDIDRGVSNTEKGTVDWIVTDLRMGSMRCSIRPVSKNAEVDIGLDVVRYGIEGLEIIEKGNSTPAYTTILGMNKAINMANVIGKNYGVTGIRIVADEREIDLTPQFIKSAKELIKPRRKSIGSVEGTVETISIRKKPHFTIYSFLTKKAITCKFVPSQFMENVQQVFGHRVNVSGIISSNVKGEPLSVEVERIRHLRSQSEMTKESVRLPYRGIDPNFTGGMSSEDYIRIRRQER